MVNYYIQSAIGNIEEESGSCINQCLDTGLLYFTDDTYINLYNVTGSGLFLSKDSNKNIGPLFLSNESWQDYYTGFTGYGLSGFNNTSAGIILNINDTTKINNQNKFRINYGANESKNTVKNYHKQLVSIRPQKSKNLGYSGFFKNDVAWTTYDVSTGMITGSLTPNNVFSYAVDIVASGKLNTGNFYYTGNIDITTATGKAYVLNLEKNPILYTENFNTLDSLSFNGVRDFCKVQQCITTEEPPPNLEICYTGEITDAAAFEFFLSGIQEIVNTTIIKRPEEKNLLNFIETGSDIEYSNTIHSGYILYNNWESGDYIKWDLYNFKYIDLYQDLHLGTYPPYPNTGFILYYPNDFNSLDSLVDRLNEKVDFFKTYPVWYPYECLRDTESGIFLTGDLMKFSKNVEETGSLPISHFNNRIDFISLRSFPRLEFDSNLYYEISIFSPQKPKKQLFSSWAYLIPTTIQLEGFNRQSQNWEILDVNGQGPQQNSIQLASFSQNFFNNLLDSKIVDTESMGFRPLPGVIVETAPKPPPTSSFETPQNCKEVLSVNQQRIVVFNENPLCPPIIQLRNIIATAPREECKEKIIDSSGNLVQKRSNAELCRDLGPPGGTGDDDDPAGGAFFSIGDYYINKTGWSVNINNSNNGLRALDNKIGIQNFDINKIYDKYKISLSNFVSIPNPDQFQKNSFFVKRIKLYTLDKTDLGLHSGTPLCSIGSDYTIDVSGLVPIKISGVWSYNIDPEESGVYKFFSTPFAREIEENEKLIRFNKVSGQIISPSGTGFLLTSGFGVGTLSYEDNSRYFYNPSTESIYFTETLTGLVTGFGVLSGEKIAIKQNVINQELLFGGRLNNNENLLYHEIVSNGDFISEIENVEYIEYDVLGFYPITGKITGNTTSGKLNVSDELILTGVPYNDKFAYYPIPTGFTFSEIVFNISYSNLNNFSILSINNNSIIYNDNTSIYSSPAYFDSNETLVSIINDSPNVFGVSGEIDGPNIKLYSLLPGEANNINLTSNSTALQIIEYVSGLNIYPRLYKITTERNQNCIDDDPELIDLPGNCIFSFSKQITDPLMTGNLGDNILATGFYYSNFGSGNITGNVSTFTGVRSFFDVWDIATGSLTKNYLSFLENNFVSGNSFYRESLFGSSPRNVRLRAFYQNYLNTSAQEEQDVADLIIKDLNNPTLSESGVIFRLNGVK
jgi:hypothetical protein